MYNVIIKATTGDRGERTLKIIDASEPDPRHEYNSAFKRIGTHGAQFVRVTSTMTPPPKDTKGKILVAKILVKEHDTIELDKAVEAYDLCFATMTIDKLRVSNFRNGKYTVVRIEHEADFDHISHLNSLVDRPKSKSEPTTKQTKPITNNPVVNPIPPVPRQARIQRNDSISSFVQRGDRYIGSFLDDLCKRNACEPFKYEVLPVQPDRMMANSCFYDAMRACVPEQFPTSVHAKNSVVQAMVQEGMPEADARAVLDGSTDSGFYFDSIEVVARNIPAVFRIILREVGKADRFIRLGAFGMAISMIFDISGAHYIPIRPLDSAAPTLPTFDDEFGHTSATPDTKILNSSWTDIVADEDVGFTISFENEDVVNNENSATHEATLVESASVEAQTTEVITLASTLTTEEVLVPTERAQDAQPCENAHPKDDTNAHSITEIRTDENKPHIHPQHTMHIRHTVEHNNAVIHGDNITVFLELLFHGLIDAHLKFYDQLGLNGKSILICSGPYEGTGKRITHDGKSYRITDDGEFVLFESQSIMNALKSAQALNLDMRAIYSYVLTMLDQKLHERYERVMLISDCKNGIIGYKVY